MDNERVKDRWKKKSVKKGKEKEEEDPALLV